MYTVHIRRRIVYCTLHYFLSRQAFPHSVRPHSPNHTDTELITATHGCQHTANVKHWIWNKCQSIISGRSRCSSYCPTESFHRTVDRIAAKRAGESLKQLSNLLHVKKLRLLFYFLAAVYPHLHHKSLLCSHEPFL